MKRGLYGDEAVVLNSLDYGESDRILTFYTLGRGKLRGIAKGARRSMRRFVGKLDPACRIRLNYFDPGASDGGGLVRVEDASLLDGFAGLKSDIERYAFACYLLELTSEMTVENEPHPEVLRLLLDFLTLANGSGEPDPLMRFYEIKLLSALGFMPHLSTCVVCRGEPSDGAAVLFVSEKGGTVCPACLRGAAAGAAVGLPFSAGTARTLAMAARLDADKLMRLKPGAAFLNEAGRALDDFIRHQTGKELKTKRFFEKMREIGVKAGGRQ